MVMRRQSGNLNEVIAKNGSLLLRHQKAESIRIMPIRSPLGSDTFQPKHQVIASIMVRPTDQCAMAFHWLFPVRCQGQLATTGARPQRVDYRRSAMGRTRTLPVFPSLVLPANAGTQSNLMVLAEAAEGAETAEQKKPLCALCFLCAPCEQLRLVSRVLPSAVLRYRGEAKLSKGQ